MQAFQVGRGWIQSQVPPGQEQDVTGRCQCGAGSAGAWVWWEKFMEVVSVVNSAPGF